MARQDQKERVIDGFFLQYYQRIYEAFFILLSTIGIFLLISFSSYSLADPGWSTTGSHKTIHNLAGKVGAFGADFFLYLFGYFAYWLPIFIFYASFVNFGREFKNGKLIDNYKYFSIRAFGFLLTLIFGAALLDLHFYEYGSSLPVGSGGVLGRAITVPMVSMFDVLGSTLIFLALFLVGVTLSTGLSWFKLIDWLGKNLFNYSIIGKNKAEVAVKASIKYLKEHRLQIVGRDLLRLPHFKQKSVEEVDCFGAYAPRNDDFAKASRNDDFADVSRKDENPVAKPSALNTALSAIKNLANKKDKPEIVLSEKKTEISKKVITNLAPTRELPILDLLEQAKIDENNTYSPEILDKMSRLVESKLADFGVEAKVVGVKPGPVIIRFELQLAPGIKVNKITTLAKDLARSLSIISVRIVEVIPGKPYVGLELPKDNREVVRLREILSQEMYQDTKSKLALALGKDISGRPVIVDLSKMPHLLVAGTTGAGKSVGINAMILSFLFKLTPDEVRLIMIDPKMLELSVYEGIPHLLTPVVTDMKDAANALRWCVGEMEYRYQLMAALGVRNLASYNLMVKEAIDNGEPLLDPLWDEKARGEPAPELKTLPFIVVVVDEFADMIMVVGRKVEELIARIAQKARAAGIHMIIATQRPSVDVITGLIKANIPTRIAYQVSSRIDSRTILDQQGAEQLLGQGDMLYLPPGSGVPKRVHGAFVDDHEVHAVVGFWKQQKGWDTGDDILNTRINIAGLPKLNIDDDSNENDPLYAEIIEFVAETRKASISSVQRRFKIGYNRAARLIEQMEIDGLVSPMQSNGVREVLMRNNQE